jgi:dTDP-4-amino-4,6-dideoxygalactose transaminase
MIKSTICELAIFGGQSAFDQPLHVGAPNIGNKEKFLARVDDILTRRWLSNGGPYEKEFEKRIAEIAGTKHAIATCNGTLALEICSRAMGLSGEVIVPAFTFVATPHALQWQEITPVFCDIDPVSCNIDPDRIESLITPRTTGIVAVHLWGRPCENEKLEAIARKRNLKLMFDSSHAFGCSYKGQSIGSFGQAEVFSFHATKFLNTLEGGAVTTNDDELASRIRLMKNFGFVNYDKVSHVGTNGKMNEVSAAMGLTSLESMDQFVATNYRNYEIYRQRLHGLPGVRVMEFDETEKCNYQYVVLEIDETRSHITRDQVFQILHAEKVLARRYFHPGCHRMEPYKSYFPHAGLLLPETERMSGLVLSLPTGTAVTIEQVHQISELVEFLILNGQEISDRLMSVPTQTIASTVQKVVAPSAPSSLTSTPPMPQLAVSSFQSSSEGFRIAQR